MTPESHALVALAPREGFSEFTPLVNLLEQHGVDCAAPTPLPVPRTLAGERSAWLFALSDVPSQESLRPRLDELGEVLGVDFVLQSQRVRQADYRLAVFDMDSTLIKCEVIDELAALHGVGDEVAAITERAMRGELDFNQSFTERLGMLEGLGADVIGEIAARLPVTEGLPELVLTLRARGVATAILSGGFVPFAEKLQAAFGFDEVHANALAVEDGVVTGQVVEPIVNGARKAELLEQLRDARGLDPSQVIAVGDGANDLPMLERAGMGIAFRAKPVVRARAAHNIRHVGLDGVAYLLGARSEIAAAAT
jgi:phosphoserine phosphatase